MSQLDLFTPTRERYALSLTPEIEQHLYDWMPVAIGVSGGKDSSAAAWATIDHLNKLNHRGPRLLIHSDLGRTEWKDSLPTCQRLADRLKTELVVVKRQAGDMMDRWLTRWANNVERYQNLECVKLILPWSTPAMRFCTSELKSAIISRELVRRFPGKTIISVTGIRRQESSNRAKMPVAKPEPRLTNATHLTDGVVWNPIIDWDLDKEVWPVHREFDLPIHEAYTTYRASRVSCCFCIMSTATDILAGLSDERNHDLYQEMCSLEINSTFSFQDTWLSDARPDLLTYDMRYMLNQSKRAAGTRQEMETWLPKHLLYTKGWPTCIPTEYEAVRLGIMREQVGKAVGIDVKYTEPSDVINRYTELFEMARERESKSNRTANNL